MEVKVLDFTLFIRMLRDHAWILLSTFEFTIKVDKVKNNISIDDGVDPTII